MAYKKKIMRYGGEMPQNVREIVCGHFRDYLRREKMIAGARRRGHQMMRLQQYNRSVDHALEQVFSAHAIEGSAKQIVRRDLLDMAHGGNAKCVNGYGCMYSSKQYVAIREDALFFAARDMGLI